MEKMILLKYL